MKLCLASCLLLALTSNLAIATELAGKESLIFTSSPHPPSNAQNKHGSDNRSSRFENISAQYSWINKERENWINKDPNSETKERKINIVGVVINGDWTEAGNPQYQDKESQNKADWDKFKPLLGSLKVPYFLGLGGNDYILNKDLCVACAIRNVWIFGRHVLRKVMPASDTANNASIDAVPTNNLDLPFDFVQSQTGSTEGLKEVKGDGGLGYIVELGAKKNIYLIQLNGHVSDKEPQLNLMGESRSVDIAYFRYNIKPIVAWLENKLEYLAKHPAPKAVVVTMNGPSVDPTIVALLDRYKIAMRILGNDGSSANCKKISDLADDSKFYCLGFSTERELLELEFDPEKKVSNVYGHSVKPVVTTVSSSLIRTAQNVYN